MRSCICWSAAAVILACSPGPDDGNDTLEPGVCGDGVLNLGEACDVPGDPGCDDACHLTDTVAWTVTRSKPGVILTYPLDVAVGADGRIVVLGYRWGGGDLPDEGEGWLLALDPEGDVLWEKEVQSPGGHEGVYPSRIAVGSDGSIYHQGFDVFSYTEDGDLRWTFAAPTIDEPGFGEGSLRSSTALAVDGDAVFTASYGIRTLNPDGPSPTDASLRRHDPATGDLLWERVLDDGDAVAYPLELAIVGSTVVATGRADLESFEGSAFVCADAGSGALMPCVAGT